MIPSIYNMGESHKRKNVKATFSFFLRFKVNLLHYVSLLNVGMSEIQALKWLVKLLDRLV